MFTEYESSNTQLTLEELRQVYFKVSSRGGASAYTYVISLMKAYKQMYFCLAPIFFNS